MNKSAPNRRNRNRSRRLKVEALENRRLLTNAPLFVESCNESGLSLRDAVWVANSQDGADTIEFDVNCLTISLSDGVIPIYDDLTIVGPDWGPDLKLTIDGGGNQIFSTPDAHNDNVFSMGIENLILTGSSSSAPAFHNGGANLTLDRVVFRDNSGGGLHHSNSQWHASVDLTIVDSTFEGNSPYGIDIYGGAAEDENPTKVRIERSTISGNQRATGDEQAAAGIRIRSREAQNDGLDVEINNSTVSGNSGGGISLGLIQDNIRVDESGDLTVTITNSTITENQLHEQKVKTNRWGYKVYSSMPYLGAGIRVRENAGDTIDLTLNNSIVARNLDFLDLPDDIGRPGVSGYTSSSSFIGQEQGDPLLTPLRDFGGETKTHAPLFGSPVIDAGSNGLTVGDKDQNGMPRERNGDLVGTGQHRMYRVVDIGSFEMQNQPIVVTSDENVDPSSKRTIREAVGEADRADRAGWDHITFAPGISNIVLDGSENGGGPVVVQSPVHIATQPFWQATRQVHVEMGALKDTVFDVTDQTFVQMDNLKISGGFSRFGGGIFNSGNLRLRNMEIESNSAVFGGGIYNIGVLTLEETTISENSARRGSGIYSTGTLQSIVYREWGGPVGMSAIVVENNQGYGAIYVGQDGIADLQGVIVQENTGGAAVAIFNALGATISQSTIAYNRSGAGLLAWATSPMLVTVENVTVSSNREGVVVGPNVGFTMNHSTVTSDRDARKQDFGIQSFGNDVTVKNSIVLGNVDDLLGGFTNASRNNVVGASHANLSILHDRNREHLGPLSDILQPLAVNGGPVKTHALTAGANIALAYAPKQAGFYFDARGFLRPLDHRVMYFDVGAYETSSRYRHKGYEPMHRP